MASAARWPSSFGALGCAGLTVGPESGGSPNVAARPDDPLEGRSPRSCLLAPLRTQSSRHPPTPPASPSAAPGSQPCHSPPPRSQPQLHPKHLPGIHSQAAAVGPRPQCRPPGSLVPAFLASVETALPPTGSEPPALMAGNRCGPISRGSGGPPGPPGSEGSPLRKGSSLEKLPAWEGPHHSAC